MIKIYLASILLRKVKANNNDDDFFLYLIFGIVLVLLILFLSKKKSNSGKLKDSEVNIELVKKLLLDFKVIPIADRKFGFTEKDIHKQLGKYLKEKIENVTAEYSLEGITQNAIDFDLGNGKIGVEVKLAKSVFKTTEWHRALGQMTHYIKRKYNSGNYVMVVVGFKDDKEHSILKELKKDVLEHKGHLIFIESEDVVAEVKTS